MTSLEPYERRSIPAEPVAALADVLAERRRGPRPGDEPAPTATYPDHQEAAGMLIGLASRGWFLMRPDDDASST